MNALLSMKDVAGRLGVSRRCLYVSAAHIRTKALPFRQSDKGTGVSGVPPDRRYRSPPSPFGDQNGDTEPESVATVPARGRSGEIEASSTPSEDFTWGIPVDSSGERELTPERFPIPEKADQKQEKTSPEIVARCC